MLSYKTVGGRGVFLLLVNFFFEVLFALFLSGFWKQATVLYGFF